MSKRIDFRVDWCEDRRELTKRILGDLFITRRAYANKPTVIVVTGRSGTGKSSVALKSMDYLYAFQGIDILTRLGYVEIFTQYEYAEKMRAFLNKKNPDTKDLNVIVLDEGREVVDATSWSSFLNRAIAKVNALSRGIKPIVFFVVTQTLQDIDTKVRRTMDYFIECSRSHHGPVRVRIYRITVNNYDIENPKHVKLPIKGIIMRDGKPKMVRLKVLKFTFPRKDLWDKYEEMQYQAKIPMVMREFDEMDKQFRAMHQSVYHRIDSMVEFYSDPEKLRLIGSRVGSKIKFNDKWVSSNDLTKNDIKEFSARLMKRLEEKGVAIIEPK